MKLKQRIALVAAARPNFMKIAPLYRALRARDDLFAPQIIHMGQHYDSQMSQVFFEDLSLPEPDVFLKVGSGTHGAQTARGLVRFEEYLMANPTDLVLVVGDVNSTTAAALAAAKLHVPIAHVEAGLRCGDRRMPEELNRLVTDCLADLLYTPSVQAGENLRAEGVSENRIVFVGNVMIDTLRALLPRTSESTIIKQLGLESGGYTLLTLHRPENVDTPEKIRVVAELIEKVSRLGPLVFPVHPRTARSLSACLSRDSWSSLVENTNLRLIDPLGYLDFLRLQKDARIVLTDSGGVQEETTALGVPCLTLRENTERPVTITEGTNMLVGLNPDRVAQLLQNGVMTQKTNRCPEKWDGKAAERIVEHLIGYFADKSPRGRAGSRPFLPAGSLVGK